MAEKLQRGGTGPVQVLQNAYDWAVLADREQQPGERVEQLPPVVIVLTARGSQLRPVTPDQRRQPQQLTRRIRLGHRADVLGDRRRDVAELLEDLGVLVVFAGPAGYGDGERLARAVFGDERQLIFIGGEPGAGKSRLAGEIAAALHRQGAIVLLGTCSPEPGVPYQPFTECVECCWAGRSRARWPRAYPALNTAFDALLPRGLQHYWKAVYAGELTDEAIAAHLEHWPRIPAVNSAVHLYPINGACHDVPADATALGHRDANYACVIAGMWPDPADNEANTRWVRDYYAALAPHSQPGGYTNFASADDQQRVRDNFGAAYGRLAETKRRYDPGNLFYLNQNITPAAR
jgi:Berberine and berberine like/AAA ATPase domain